MNGQLQIKNMNPIGQWSQLCGLIKLIDQIQYNTIDTTLHCFWLSSSSWIESFFYNLGRYTCLVAFFKFAPYIAKVGSNGQGCPNSLLSFRAMFFYVWFFVTLFIKTILDHNFINEMWCFGGFYDLLSRLALDFKHWSNRLYESYLFKAHQGIEVSSKRVHLVSLLGNSLLLASETRWDRDFKNLKLSP